MFQVIIVLCVIAHIVGSHVSDAQAVDQKCLDDCRDAKASCKAACLLDCEFCEDQCKEQANNLPFHLK
ncbi:hypothetical protein CSKR_201436 [Clonorchis sinensis]|uniref:Uncharacterized protein n=1 Tax=Clonorchis sinensis TaxID=79923 RepID=A0A8T1MRH0_CLOSI|nr:hypothetical protein CSKR_201436 [Clonorchis sinensis]